MGLYTRRLSLHKPVHIMNGYHTPQLSIKALYHHRTSVSISTERVMLSYWCKLFIRNQLSYFCKFLFHSCHFFALLCSVVLEKVMEIEACLGPGRRSKAAALRLLYECTSDVFTSLSISVTNGPFSVVLWRRTAFYRPPLFINLGTVNAEFWLDTLISTIYKSTQKMATVFYFCADIVLLLTSDCNTVTEMITRCQNVVKRMCNDICERPSHCLVGTNWWQTTRHSSLFIHRQ